MIISLCSLNTRAQTNNFTAQYKVVLTLNKESKADKMMTDMFGDFEKMAKQLDFTLSVNNDENLFFLEEKVYTNDELAELVTLKSDYQGRVFLKDSILFTEIDSKNLNVKAILKKQLPEWELHNETKVIQGYTCLKATTTKVVQNKAGLFTFPITAWYCPQINSSLGPIGYGGLPGLIFELRGNKYVYGLQKIAFNTVDNVEKLKGYKVVGQMELDMMIQPIWMTKQ